MTLPWSAPVTFRNSPGRACLVRADFWSALFTQSAVQLADTPAIASIWLIACGVMGQNLLARVLELIADAGVSGGEYAPRPGQLREFLGGFGGQVLIEKVVKLTRALMVGVMRNRRKQQAVAR